MSPVRHSGGESLQEMIDRYNRELLKMSGTAEKGGGSAAGNNHSSKPRPEAKEPLYSPGGFMPRPEPAEPEDTHRARTQETGDSEQGMRDIEQGNRDREQGMKDMEQARRDREQGLKDAEQGRKDAEQGRKDASRGGHSVPPARDSDPWRDKLDSRLMALEQAIKLLTDRMHSQNHSHTPDHSHTTNHSHTSNHSHTPDHDHTPEHSRNLPGGEHRDMFTRAAVTAAANPESQREQWLRDLEQGRRDLEQGIRDYERGMEELRQGLRDYELGIAQGRQPQPGSRPAAAQLQTGNDTQPSLTGQEGFGTLIVQAFTARQAEPVAGAQVVVTLPREEGELLFRVMETDEDGRTPPLRLPVDKAPEGNGYTAPFADYRVYVNAAGYRPSGGLTAQMFAGITSVLPVELIPGREAMR